MDDKITALVLRALEPSALEVSLQVAEDVEAERMRLEETWQKRLERAQYEVDRARRQYDAVEPENRLVARTLEKQWEEKLSAKRTLEEEHDRFMAQQPAILSAEERDAIRALAADIPALWAAATTTPQDRQIIIRQMVEHVVVKVEGESERVDIEVQWVGGHKTLTRMARPVARLEQLSYYADLVERVFHLQTKGITSDEIAQTLNEEGWRPAKRRATFNGSMVRDLIYRHRKRHPPQKRTQVACALDAQEWLLPDLAAELSMPTVTLYSWLQRGWLQGRQLDEPHRRWVIYADAKELARLRALRQAPKRGWHAAAGTGIPRA